MTEQLPQKLLLGQILKQRGLINEDQLNIALSVQNKEGKLLGEVLMKKGYVNEKDVVVALIVQGGFPYIALSRYQIDAKSLALISRELARKLLVLPLERLADVLNVVMVDPLDEHVLLELKNMTQCKIVPFISTKT